MEKKISIIVPVLNVEQYLRKCLDSIVSQNYNNYEAIIICDKCTDNSEKIVDDYIKKYTKFKKIYAEKTGLAKARNIGINECTGDYILFLDSDDYLELDCLNNLNEELKENPDVLRYQVQDIKDNSIIKHVENSFDITNGINAFKKILNYHYIEPSWCYVYNTNFWKTNNFKFMENCIAEDYGLTPIILYKAKKVKSIDYIGYNYVIRDNSLMTNKNYEMKLKKADDMLKQAEFLKERINSNEIISFINNSLIKYVTTLNYKDYKKYNRFLKKHGYYKHFKITGFTTLKNVLLIKLNAYMFYRYMVR